MKTSTSLLLCVLPGLLGIPALHAQDPQPDTTPPTITCPPDMVEWCVDPAGQAVFFDPPMVADIGDPEVVATCVPESGSHFPMGATVVTCTAKDVSGNQSQCSFKVTVKLPDFGIEMRGGRVTLLNECLWPVQHSFDLAPANWDPLYDPPAPDSNHREFFRLVDPKQNPGISFDQVDESITYVATGLMQDWYNNGAFGGAHIGSLLWAQDDLSAAGGSVVLQPPPAESNFTNRWSGVIDIPFNFHFYGKSFHRCCVAWNGLLTFDTTEAGTTVNDLFAGYPADAPTELATWPLPNPNLPNYTICGFYTNTPEAAFALPEQQPVRAYLLGTAPRRQVWFVYPGDVHLFSDPPNGIGSHTLRRAIVLEEGTNRVLIADMFDQNHEHSAAAVAAAEEDEEGAALTASTVVKAAASHRYVIGIQKNRSTALSIPASPKAALNNEGTGYKDNDYYDFTPRHLAPLVQGTGHSTLASFDERPLAWLAARNIPGATVAAAKGGRMVYNKGFGHARVFPAIPMLPTHRSCIGSTSKMFTTMGLFRLIEEGKLSTADLAKHVYEDPNLLGIPAVQLGLGYGLLTADEVTRLKTVNLHHLLTHTAMISRSGDTWETSVNLGINYDLVTYADAVTNFFGFHHLVTPEAPGIVKSYSNHGVGQVGWLTGIVAQCEYGQDYDAYLQDHVLKPIGIQHMRGRTDWIHDETYRDAFRYAYYTSASVLPHADSRMTGLNGPPQYEQSWNISNAAGGWTATAADLVRLMCAQDGLANHKDLLSAPLRQLLHSRPFGDTSLDVEGKVVAAHAHGWVYDKDTEILSHNGDIGYGSSYLMMMPNDGVIDGNLNWNQNSIVVAVCLNASNTSVATVIATELRDKLTTVAIPWWYDLLGANN